jgi:uncharacterized membrane protein
MNMKLFLVKTKNQTVKAKIILTALITLYGICGIIYAAELLANSQKNTGSINSFIIYGIFNIFIFISGIIFLYTLLSKPRQDDTDSKLRDSYASFRHSVTNLP